jgi:hypothetical protein
MMVYQRFVENTTRRARHFSLDFEAKRNYELPGKRKDGHGKTRRPSSFFVGNPVLARIPPFQNRFETVTRRP